MASSTPPPRKFGASSIASPTRTKTPEVEARTCSLAQVFDIAAVDAECGDTVKQSADGSSDQVDAWDIEDWGLSGLMLEHTKSICSAASDLDENQQRIADTVHADLKVDLEAMVHHAVDQIRSWVSAEIACARQTFDKAACDIHDNWVTEESELKQMLADERCWRLQMGALQDVLDKQLQSVQFELWEMRCSSFAERLSTYDCDAHEFSGSLLEAAQQGNATWAHDVGGLNQRAADALRVKPTDCSVAIACSEDRCPRIGLAQLRELYGDLARLNLQKAMQIPVPQDAAL